MKACGITSSAHRSPSRFRRGRASSRSLSGRSKCRGERAVDCSYHWVVALLFQIVDIAIQACKYPNPFNHLLPKIVWEENAEPAVVEIGDIFSPKGSPADQAKRGCRWTRCWIVICRTTEAALPTIFLLCVCHAEGTQLKYVPTGVLVAEQSLEQFKGFQSRAGRMQPRSMPKRFNRGCIIPSESPLSSKRAAGSEGGITAERGIHW